jgi:IS4 transposase
MAFAQLTYRESLRDIETCLHSLGSKLYHSGIRSHVSRSTLADANENRPWRIYNDLALALIKRARILYRDDKLLKELQSALYAFDSTNIDLCLSLFPWATSSVYQKTNAGIKLHTLLDVQSQLPVFIRVTAANVHDVRILDDLIIEPGAHYVMDRAYMDFSRLKKIDEAGAFFVIRAKDNLLFHRVYSHVANKSVGIMADQTIVLDVQRSHSLYPDQLRRIRFFDTERDRTLIFLTNNFALDAFTITQLYRSRWQIELFFKWIKQHLRIKSFFGTSPNAVRTQIWIAVSVYLLIAIVKKELRLNQSLYTILQILSVTLFEKEPIYQVLTDDWNQTLVLRSDNQLNLFNF